MTAPEPTPTAEHIDAVAVEFEHVVVGSGYYAMNIGTSAANESARAILTSSNPETHEALAANLPADVMLAALVDRLGHDEWRLRFRNGSATRETDDFEDIARWMQRGDVVEARRVLPAQSTPWEVAE